MITNFFSDFDMLSPNTLKENNILVCDSTNSMVLLHVKMYMYMYIVKIMNV